MITAKADRVTKKKFRTKNTQATEEALLNMFKTGHAAAANVLEDAFYRYIEIVLIKMALKCTLDNHFIRDVKRWGQAPEFMDAFTNKVFKLRTFTNPLGTFVKQRIDNTVTEWRLNGKEKLILQKEIHTQCHHHLRRTHIEAKTFKN